MSVTARSRGRAASGGVGRGDEIVRRQADATLRLAEIERLAHRTIEPRAWISERRPNAFVEAAEDRQVGLLQTRFERAPDVQPRVLAEARANRRCIHERADEGDI